MRLVAKARKDSDKRMESGRATESQTMVANWPCPVRREGDAGVGRIKIGMERLLPGREKSQFADSTACRSLAMCCG